MNCKNCGCGLPTKRIELGFKQCVNCSTVETYGTVDIVYHKTGNTVQHVDKETANQINKLSRRPGFGSNLGRIGKGGVKEFSRKIEIGCNNNTIGSDGLYQKVHDKVELLFLLVRFCAFILWRVLRSDSFAFETASPRMRSSGQYSFI